MHVHHQIPCPRTDAPHSHPSKPLAPATPPRRCFAAASPPPPRHTLPEGRPRSAARAWATVSTVARAMNCSLHSDRVSRR